MTGEGAGAAGTSPEDRVKDKPFVMSAAAGAQNSVEDEVDYWIKYIDCAIKHPRPLPSGTHAFNLTYNMRPEVREVYHCLYKLYSEESVSVPFREPVNALALGVFTYYDVVKHPMSLRVVLDRIASGEYYSTVQQVEEDVAKIWQNCAAFNGPTSPITASSKSCAERLTEIRRRFREDEPASEAEVNRIFDLYGEVESDEVSDALTEYFKKADPGRLTNGELELANLQRKHVPEMLKIIERYIKK